MRGAELLAATHTEGVSEEVREYLIKRKVNHLVKSALDEVLKIAANTTAKSTEKRIQYSSSGAKYRMELAEQLTDGIGNNIQEVIAVMALSSMRVTELKETPSIDGSAERKKMEKLLQALNLVARLDELGNNNEGLQEVAGATNILERTPTRIIRTAEDLEVDDNPWVDFIEEEHPWPAALAEEAEASRQRAQELALEERPQEMRTVRTRPQTKEHRTTGHKLYRSQVGRRYAYLNMQGFLIRGEFSPKEVALLLDGGECLHLLLKEPHSQFTIDTKGKQNIRYARQNLHGLTWGDGEVNYRRGVAKLTLKLAGVDRIYIKECYNSPIFRYIRERYSGEITTLPHNPNFREVVSERQCGAHQGSGLSCARERVYAMRRMATEY